MRDDNFDKYLAEILGEASDATNKDSASAVATESKTEDEFTETDGLTKIQEEITVESAGVETVDSETAEDEEIGDFAEKTIKFSNGDIARMTAAIKNSELLAENETVEPTEPESEPATRRKKKKVRKANYSAYGGIVLATLVLCCSIIISLFVIVVGRDFLGIDTNNNAFTLYIPQNYSVDQIAQLLTENGIIEYPEVFIRFARLKVGNDGIIYPGDIEVMPSMSYSDILDSLMEAREARETVSVTITEGMTIDDAARLLEENGVCSADEFTYTFNSSIYGFGFENYVGSSSLKYYKYEGYLFPDTYEFYIDDTAYNAARKIKEKTNDILTTEVISRCQELGYTLDQIVTLASILQLESGVKSEMEQIAGVFYNRLNNPSEFPRLQSDTSYRYIENVIKAGSTIDYQEMYDAYDTYVCTGLPVGAICNPGEDAIMAALYPAENDYYYFCSNLETGEFYYSTTYEEHLANVELAGLNSNA